MLLAEAFLWPTISLQTQCRAIPAKECSQIDSFWKTPAEPSDAALDVIFLPMLQHLLSPHTHPHPRRLSWPPPARSSRPTRRWAASGRTRTSTACHLSWCRTWWRRGACSCAAATPTCRATRWPRWWCSHSGALASIALLWPGSQGKLAGWLAGGRAGSWYIPFVVRGSSTLCGSLLGCNAQSKSMCQHAVQPFGWASGRTIVAVAAGKAAWHPWCMRQHSCCVREAWSCLPISRRACTGQNGAILRIRMKFAGPVGPPLAPTTTPETRQHVPHLH